MINKKYGSYHRSDYLNAFSNTSQTITASNQTFYWNIENVISNKNIIINDVNKITFNNSGRYNFQFSAQIVSNNSSSHTVSIWLEKNGSNLENSCTDYTLAGNGQASVAILNFILDANKDDYYKIAWSDSVDCSLQYVGTRSNPSRPETPSIILTVWKI